MRDVWFVLVRFTDEQVLSKDFREELKRVIEITKPMVYWYVHYSPAYSSVVVVPHTGLSLNDYMTVGVGDDNDDDDGDDQGGNEGGDGGEEDEGE